MVTTTSDHVADGVLSLAAPPPPGRVRSKVDPISLQVLGGTFRSIAREMAECLYRMAFSNLIRDCEDLGAGIFDVHGRTICESDTTPMHCGSIPSYIRGADRRLAGRYRPGDVIVHNNPYYGASHTPDYGVIVPIFHAARHVGFAACTGHMIDVGGAAPSYAVDVADLWAEGKIFDAAKLYDGGVRNDELFTHMLDNVRAPAVHGGDLEAMIACCELGRRRFTHLLEVSGEEQVFSAAEDWMDYSERMLRKEIEAIPDGIYRASEGWIEGGEGAPPLNVNVSVTVSGTDLLVDVTGSHADVATAINVPLLGATLPAITFALRTLLLDEADNGAGVPQNEGIFRPISAIVPAGTLYNPRFPRPSVGRMPAANRLCDQIISAFRTARPERVTAGNSAAVQAIVWSGFTEDAGEYWVYFEVGEGAYGARHGRDGLDAVDTLLPNTRNTPIEETELRSPMRCNRYELRDVAPAAGRWRGGLASVREWEVLADATLGTNGDFRVADPPSGMLGGQSGSPGGLMLHAPGDGARPLASKVTNLRLPAGSRITADFPGGGGYGSPLQREPAGVRDDVLDGLISVAQAREVYGVVVGADGKLDPEATAARRVRADGGRA